METTGPPWLAIIVAGISLVGVVVTAVVGPLVVARLAARRATPESLESSAIIERVSDAVALVQSAVTDLQTPIGRLEVMQMTDAHDHHG